MLIKSLVRSGQCLLCCQADTYILYIDNACKALGRLKLLDIFFVLFQAIECYIIGNEQLTLRECTQLSNCCRDKIGKERYRDCLVCQCCKIGNYPLCRVACIESDFVAFFDTRLAEENVILRNLLSHLAICIGICTKICHCRQIPIVLYRIIQ